MLVISVKIQGVVCIKLPDNLEGDRLGQIFRMWTLSIQALTRRIACVLKPLKQIEFK